MRSWHGVLAIVAFRGEAYRKEAPDASPHGIVGQLPPAALVHDGALVDATTNKVDEHGDQGHDAEDTTGAQSLCFLVHTTAGKGRAALEEIGAIVYGSDERDASLAQRVALAQQRDDGRLAAFAIRLLAVRVGIAVLVLVLVLVVIVNDFARLCGERDGTAPGL
jgi:hypothetical protein